MIHVKLGKSMEEMFFYQKEQSQLEAKKALEQMKETKENLAKVSGIKNEAVLEKLIALGIRPETLATLFAIPLVEVAWADGELQEQEREQLFKSLGKSGSKNNGFDRKMVSAWLSQKPAPALMKAWADYMRALCGQLSEAERRALKEEVLADARDIAQAAGGFLGFGKLSEEEAKVLAELEAAFG